MRTVGHQEITNNRWTSAKFCYHFRAFYMKELNHLNEQIIINDKYVIRVNILHIIRYLKIYAHLLILAVFSGQDCS